MTPPDRLEAPADENARLKALAARLGHDRQTNGR